MTTETPSVETPPTPTPAPTPAPEGDAYAKLLKEKQNWAEKAKIAEAKLQETETARLKEKDDQKGLAEMYLKKYEELDAKLKSQEAEQQRAIKLTQVKKEWEKLGLKDANVAEKLYKMVDLDKVKYDPELKLVIGQEDEAKRIFEDFKPLFTGEVPRADHSAPKGIPAEISVDSYTRMVQDGSFNKLTKEQQREFQTRLYASKGVTVRK